MYNNYIMYILYLKILIKVQVMIEYSIFKYYDTIKFHLLIFNNLSHKIGLLFECLRRNIFLNQFHNQFIVNSGFNKLQTFKNTNKIVKYF